MEEEKIKTLREIYQEKNFRSVLETYVVRTLERPYDKEEAEVLKTVIPALIEEQNDCIKRDVSMWVNNDELINSIIESLSKSTEDCLSKISQA